MADAHLGQVGLAHYHLRNYNEALNLVERGLITCRQPHMVRTLLATFGQLGRIDEANTVREELEHLELAEPARYWRRVRQPVRLDTRSWHVWDRRSIRRGILENTILSGLRHQLKAP